MGFKVESKNWIEVVKEDIGRKTCRNQIYEIKIKIAESPDVFLFVFLHCICFNGIVHLLVKRFA